MSYYEFFNPVKLISGEGCVQTRLPAELKKLRAKRWFFISGPIITKLGLGKDVEQAVQNAGAVIAAKFTAVPNDSSVETVNEIVKMYRDENADGIIAIGGGSVLDTAKAVRLSVIGGAADLRECYGYNMLHKGAKVPFVAIPTTCGTGSEVTKVSVISDENNGAKEEIISDLLLPDLAVCDCRMLQTLPKKSILLTAFDALSHAVEAYCSRGKNPLSDTYSYLAISGIIRNLPKVLDCDTFDAKGCEALLLSASLAGISFSNSMVGGVHAIAHSVGSTLGVAHDFAVATMLPYVLAFNMQKSYKNYAKLSRCFGFESGLTDEQLAAKFVDYIYAFLAENAAKIGGIPTLEQCGLNDLTADIIAKSAVTDGAILTNPHIVEYNDVMQLLGAAKRLEWQTLGTKSDFEHKE